MSDTELRRAVRAFTAIISNGEWAEHVSTDPDARALESAITDLHNEISRIHYSHWMPLPTSPATPGESA